MAFFDLANIFSIQYLALLVLLSPAFVAIYRLYFSPLAKFPGPKLAALTYLYAAYYDVYFGDGGQYIWKVEKMHHRYGPIVRIRPDVLHINDPLYINELYTPGSGPRREKYKTTLNAIQAEGSGLGTRDHDLHRRRRAVLNPYFSMQNVRRLEPVIQETLRSLLGRMAGWAQAGTVVPLNVAFKATTKDIIAAYAFGHVDKCLDMEDLNAPFFDAIAPVRTNQLGIYLYYVSKLLQSLPPSIIIKLVPKVTNFVHFMQGMNAQVEDIRKTQEEPKTKTIFHEMLQANIPESEKETRRLADEAMVLLIAGMETTAQTLAAITYRLLTNPPILKHLKRELESALPNPTDLPEASKLDGLPFLNAVIQETIRLHPGVSIRQDRVAPDQDLIYRDVSSGKEYTIPAGTAVGMTAPLLSRLPLIYPNPQSFIPERYLDNPSLSRYQLAFSKGSRQCIGMNLAMTELQVITAGIFRRYDAYDGTGKQTGPTLELYETTEEDVMIACDYVTTGITPSSAGVRVVVRHGAQA